MVQYLVKIAIVLSLTLNCYSIKMLPVELIYFESYKSKEDVFEREKELKNYGSGLRNLKIRLRDNLKEGGAW